MGYRRNVSGPESIAERSQSAIAIILVSLAAKHRAAGFADAMESKTFLTSRNKSMCENGTLLCPTIPCQLPCA